MGQPISTLKLPWVTSSPLVLPDQLGDGVDKDQLDEGLQRLIACEGVGAVLLFGSRALGTARADSDLDLAVICRESELNSAQRGSAGGAIARPWGSWAAEWTWCCKARTMPPSLRVPAGM